MCDAFVLLGCCSPGSAQRKALSEAPGTESAVRLEAPSPLCSSPSRPLSSTPQNITFQLRASIKNRFVLINLKSKLFKGSFSGRVYEKSEKGPKASSTGKTGGSSQRRKEGSAAPRCEFWLTDDPLESTLSGALRIHSTKRTDPFPVN